MTKFISTLIFTALIFCNGQSFSQDITGPILRVIEKEQTTDRNNVYLEILDSASQRKYYVDDYFLVFLVERTHHILLSDFVKTNFKDTITIKLEGAKFENQKKGDKQVQFITKFEKIYPNYPVSSRGYDYSSLNPGKPSPDFHHRYIQVPKIYSKPESGTFNLYYEVCSDFDPNKPTVLIATDGQRSLSQVGWADKYKKMFGLDFNTVTYEYRGMFASHISEVSNKNTDWNTLFEILNADNVVEDMERIRRDLLGDEKIYVLGGSGTAMMGLKYAATYPEKVEKAFLMSFFKDTKGSSEAGVYFFDKFLTDNNLKETYKLSLKEPWVNQDQLLFIIQRLFYWDKSKVEELLKQVKKGERKLYNQYTKMVGDVDIYIRSVQKYKPWTVVFMYETNIKTSLGDLPDINYPFYEMGAPLRKARQKNSADLFDIQHLNKLKAPVLLVAGSLDQVAPVKQLERIHEQLPNSKLAVIEAYHCLQSSDESKQCRAQMANMFFKDDQAFTAVNKFLNKENKLCKVIRILK